MIDDPLQQFWDQILSREPEKILAAYQSLDETTRRQLILHLRRMATEPGWHPVQIQSALIALDVLGANKKKKVHRHKS